MKKINVTNVLAVVGGSMIVLSSVLMVGLIAQAVMDVLK